ncbi:multidrug efflux pump subunit AcrB [Chryseobacterium sp. BIGb0186]|nr:multidrug efflux pump subunit AcrB [Chryseobacterium sp. JUb44]MDH6208714.1 multidrug efflux pump subunit AcrB [Chryseobacterium sp. BIGb0186]
MLLIKAYKCRKLSFLDLFVSENIQKIFYEITKFYQDWFFKKKINSFEFIRKTIMRFVKNTILSSYFVNVITAFFLKKTFYL